MNELGEKLFSNFPTFLYTSANRPCYRYFFKELKLELVYHRDFINFRFVFEITSFIDLNNNRKWDKRRGGVMYVVEMGEGEV